MKPNWLDPAWHQPEGYQYAATHTTSDAFAARQRARMAAAQAERAADTAEVAAKVKPITKRARP